MSAPRKGKLNHFLQNLVPGIVITSPFLAEMGISKELARTYVMSGWLERIGRGAFIRAGDSVSWQGAVYALQTQLNLTVHVGGVSALRLKGMGHYLPLGNESVALISDGVERMPRWFTASDWWTEVNHCVARLFSLEPGASLSALPHKGFRILVSSPERAAFEMVSLVKNNQDFDVAHTVFDGLTSLRPKEVQGLLESCVSIRVKRIFLWMANDAGHPWVKYLNLDKVSLGSGKRLVYSGGRLDKEFQITVPKRQGESHV